MERETLVLAISKLAVGGASRIQPRTNDSVSRFGPKRREPPRTYRVALRASKTAIGLLLLGRLASVGYKSPIAREQQLR
jgi:hypothetical protein